MSDFVQKIVIAALGAVIGGGIGFGSEYYFFNQKISASQEAFEQERAAAREDFEHQVQAAKSEWERNRSATIEDLERQLQAAKDESERKAERDREQFALEERYDFIKEIYDERKEAYLEIKSALLSLQNSPSEDSVQELLSAVFGLPVLRSRFPTNAGILQMSQEIEIKIEEIGSENYDKIKAFAKDEMDKYLCAMNVNLSTIEGILQYAAEADGFDNFHEEQFNDDLWFLDGSCLDPRNR